MSTESTIHDNQQIGAILRDERIARGLSCEEISRDCKLQEVFIRAIEEGHTDYLPSHIYFRMFAKLYADTLAIDPEQLLGKLYPELPLPEKPEFAGAVSRARALEERRSQELPSTNQRLESGSGAINSTGISPTKISPALRNQPQYDMSGLSGQTPEPATNRNKTMVKRALAVVGVLALFVIAKNTVLNNGFADDDTGSTTKSSIVTDANDTNSESPVATYQPREKLTLTIKAKPSAKNAGVVVIADGDTLFNRKIRSGEVYTWNSDYRFKLDISDKDQVEIFIGGQRLQTPKGSSKHISGFEITQLNYEEMLAAPLSAVSSNPTE